MVNSACTPVKKVFTTPSLLLATISPVWTVGMDMPPIDSCPTGYKLHLDVWGLWNTSNIMGVEQCVVPQVGLPFRFFGDQKKSEKWNAFCDNFPITSARDSFAEVSEEGESDAITTACNVRLAPLIGAIIGVCCTAVMTAIIFVIINDISSVTVRLSCIYFLGGVATIAGAGAIVTWYLMHTNLGEVPISELINNAGSRTTFLTLKELIEKSCAASGTSCTVWKYGYGFFAIIGATGLVFLSTLLIILSRNLIKRLDTEDQERRDRELPYYERTNHFIMKRNVI